MKWLKEVWFLLVDPVAYFDRNAASNLRLPLVIVSTSLIVNATALFLWGSQVINAGVPDFLHVIFSTSLAFSLIAVALGGYFTWLVGSLAIHSILLLWAPARRTPVKQIAHVVGMSHVTILVSSIALLLAAAFSHPSIQQTQSPESFLQAVQGERFLHLAAQLRVAAYIGLCLYTSIGVVRTAKVRWNAAVVSVLVPSLVLVLAQQFLSHFAGK